MLEDYKMQMMFDADDGYWIARIEGLCDLPCRSARTKEDAKRYAKAYILQTVLVENLAYVADEGGGAFE